MSVIDQLENRIKFIEKSGEAQKIIAKSQSDRIQLEIELNRMLNSEDAIAKSKALKLKIYYDKLCEDESKSLRRNQLILDDLKRVDHQFQMLETKLERLKHIKTEMETFFKTAYPKWTNESKIFERPIRQSDQLYIDGDERANTRTLNSLMEALRPKKDAPTIADESMSRIRSPPSSPAKSSVIKSLIIPHSRLVDDEVAAPPTRGRLPPPPTVISQQQQQLESRKMDDDQTMLLLQSTNVENNLLKAYEQEIKRRDMNMLDMNASSTLNLNGLGASIDLNRDEDMFKLNQIEIDNRLQQPPVEAIHKTGSSLRQDINLSGLFNLLDFIDQEIIHAINPEYFYRQVEPHYKNKLEIIRLARENKPLSQIDPTEASMVVLDQLPAVIDKHTKNKCLFTRDLLGLSVADISEQLVAKSLAAASPQDGLIWRRLVKHWQCLIDSDDTASNRVIAQLFAPALVGYTNNAATGVEKAAKFLEKILADMRQQQQPQTATQTARSLTETSINQELAVMSSSKLKESTFYQDFIQGGSSGSGGAKQHVGKQVKKSINNDDDENDDIDALVAPKSLMSTTSSGNRAKTAAQASIQIIKSPRGANEYDFDFSQNSISESQKVPKVLQSLRSTGDKDKLPVHLRNLDSDDESESTLEISTKTKSKGQKSDADFDFYN